MDKIERLIKVEKIAHKCCNCDLGKTRKKLVFGEGNPNSLFMFIGEAPGRSEDEQGRPFVGRSGQLLRNMLFAIGIDPIEDVYISNVLRCRPPNNRRPEQYEIDMCIKFLKKQIEIINPKLIVLLGRSAVRGICSGFTEESIEKLRSISKNLGMITYESIPIFITYHPSALLRTQWRRINAKEDFLFLQEKYRELKDEWKNR